MQFELLKKIIGWAYDKSKFYRQSFQSAAVTPDDLKTFDDIKKFPFVTLAELNREDAMDFLTLPLSSILRINYIEDAEISTMNFYTKDDIIKNVEMMIRCLQAAKIYRGSTVGVICDLSDSKFLDVIYALESMQVAVLPFGNDSRQWIKILDNFGIDTLIGTPQFFENLIEQIRVAGKNFADYPIQKIICLNTKNNFYENKNIQIYNLFAPAEIGTAGIFFQCDNTSGYHVQEDHFFIEIDDETGELVITTLTAQARPLIRYRTRQFVLCTNDFCSCGRKIFYFKK